MNAVPFDTLKLEASGMAGAMAAGTSEALAEAMSGAELSTKADIDSLRSVVKDDIASLRTELKGDIASLRTELKGDIANLRTELKSDSEILRHDVVIRFGGMLVVAVGVLLTAIRYLPPHP